MDKPASLLLQEFKDKLANVINTSGLSSIIIEMILFNAYQEVKELNNKIYQNDKEVYEASLGSKSKTIEEK